MRKRATRPLAATSALLLALAGCDPTAVDGVRRVVGIIEWVDASGAQPQPATVLEIPDTVQAGIPITAMVRTIGPNGCYRESGGEVTVGPGVAVITPFDDVADQDICTAVFQTLPRPVDITFETAGPTRVRVNGRRVEGGNVEAATETAIEREIVVVPQ